MGTPFLPRSSDSLRFFKEERKMPAMATAGKASRVLSSAARAPKFTSLRKRAGAAEAKGSRQLGLGGRSAQHKPLEFVSSITSGSSKVGRSDASFVRDVVVKASDQPAVESSSGMNEKLVTCGFIALWYGVNVAFNLTNKSLFKHFPYPWTVSTVHVLVGTIYCAATYFLGAKNASFGRPVSKKEFGMIFAPASMHALGHIAANLSLVQVCSTCSWGRLRRSQSWPLLCQSLVVLPW